MKATIDMCEKIGNSLRSINNKKHLSKDVQEHLDNCLKCLIFFSRDQNLKKRLKQVVQNVTVPKHLEPAVKQFVQNGKKEYTKNRIRSVQ